MNLEETRKEECVILKPLSGNIDSIVSKEFKNRVVDLINEGNKFFILNLSKVNFVDSSGLGTMISILKMLTLNNGEIVLCELKAPLMSLLEVTRLKNIFKIFSSEKEGFEFLIQIKKNDA